MKGFKYPNSASPLSITISSLFLKILLHLPDRVENKKGSTFSVQLFNIFKSDLYIMIGVLELYKKMWEVIWKLPHNLVFLFPGGKWMARKKVKISKISGSMPPIFFILLPCFWEHNRLLNKNYWNDFDIIDQGHGNGKFSKFCLHLRYPWTNFNTISTTMKASRPATTTNVLSSDLESVGQGHHLKNRCISTIQPLFTKLL